MHSAGLELTKLTYTRVQDNLIRHRGDRLIDSHLWYTYAEIFICIQYQQVNTRYSMYVHTILSLSCDHGLDYASYFENTNANSVGLRKQLS